MPENLTLPALLEAKKADILSRFPKLNDWLTPEIWWSIVESLRNDPKLNECARENPNSIVSALVTLADWGLKPDRSEAFINVYKIEGVLTAQAQWIWQGGVRRAVDSGVIAHAVPDIIREGDMLEEFVDKDGRHLKHTRVIGASNRKVIGSYALFWLKNGLMDYELCDLEDIERAKEASKRQVGKLTPAWNYAYSEQAKKTAIRRGLKRMVGKRDKGFDSMVQPQTAFDAETTAIDAGELSPDETPRAKESPHHDPEREVPVTRSGGSQTGAAHIGETVPLETAGNAHTSVAGASSERPVSPTERPVKVVQDESRGGGEQPGPQEGAALAGDVLPKGELAMLMRVYNACKHPDKWERVKKAVPGLEKLEDVRSNQIDAVAAALA